MPNWCHCTLTVVGDTEELRRFVEEARPSEELISRLYSEGWLAAEGEKLPWEEFVLIARELQPLSFHSLVPEPPAEELREFESDGHPGWYMWRLVNWGTKWDAYFGDPLFIIGADSSDPDVSIKAKGATVTPTAAVYKFDTAWSPPIELVERVSRRFDGLEFTLSFGEPGSGRAGRVRYVAGTCAERVDLPVEEVLAPEEMWF